MSDPDRDPGGTKDERASVAHAAGARPLRVDRRGLVPYGDGLELQARLIDEVRSGDRPETLVLLEHPPVLTRGTGSHDEHLLADEAERARLGIELFDAGRGGDITYHGPGQLVGYPILDLKPDRKDLHRYLRDLESMVMAVLGHFGIDARREEGLTGVWTDTGKIAAIGVRVSSGWITSHGFALNVQPDLSHFGTIVPCGIADRTVTSMAVELGTGVPTMDEVARVVVRQMAREFDRVIAD